MTITSGFFDSVSGDRVYSSDAFNQLFDGLITDGVIGPVGDQFSVLAGTGMTVNVNTGRAWFNRTWLDNNAVHILALQPASASFGRYDIVVLDFNKSPGTRENDILIVTGTPASTPVLPTLIDTDTHKQVPLANVFIPAGASEPMQVNITNRVGTDSCPFATGMLQQFSLEDLLIQWESAFDTWFDNLVDQLSGVQVTNLQNQIDTLKDRNLPGRNILINTRMNVLQRTGTITPISASGYHNGVPDRWMVMVQDAGAVVPTVGTRTDFGIGRNWLTLTASTAKASPSATSFMLLSQRIEGKRLKDVYFGTPEAKELTLSFLFRSNKTGTYIYSLYSGLHSLFVSKSFLYPTANTTQLVTLTFPANSTVAFSLASEHVLTAELWLVAGSNFTSGAALQTTWGSTAVNNTRARGQTNLMSAVNNYISITDIQLEAGSEATPYERVENDVVLSQCERYYEVVDSRSCTIISIRNDGYCRVDTHPFNTPKRVAPTIEYLVVTWVGAPPNLPPGVTPSGDLTTVSAGTTPFGFDTVGGIEASFTTPNKAYWGRYRYAVSSEL